MSVSVQESMLDMCDQPSLGALGASVRRTPLAHGAWVDLRAGWLTGSGAVFGALVEAVPWRAEKRHMYDKVVAVPRLLCFYGEDAPLPDPVLTAARRALSAHYGPELGEPFRTAGLCLYRDGRDSVAWHGDTIGRGENEDTMVAIVSLGTPRALLLRPRGGGQAGRAGRLAAVRGRPWRPAGHGRQLPAHLGARRPEDVPGGRAADQRAIPAPGRALRPGACAEARGVR